MVSDVIELIMTERILAVTGRRKSAMDNGLGLERAVQAACRIVPVEQVKLDPNASSPVTTKVLLTIG